MPNAEEQSSPKKKGGAIAWALILIFFILFFFIALAGPKFASYSMKSRVSDVVATTEGIRAALASFAADSPGNAFPVTDSIRNYATLQAMVNANGGTLKATESAMGIRFERYEAQDTDGDGLPDSYELTLFAVHKTHQQKLSVTPAGVERIGNIEPVSQRR